MGLAPGCCHRSALVLVQCSILTLPLPTQAGCYNVDAASIEGQYTPLMLAALAGHAPAVRSLLARGASLQRRSRRGSTALHLAASSAANQEALAALLAHPSCSPALVRQVGFRDRSALMLSLLAHGSGPVVRQLIRAGADVDEKVQWLGWREENMGAAAGCVTLVAGAGRTWHAPSCTSLTTNPLCAAATGAIHGVGLRAAHLRPPVAVSRCCCCCWPGHQLAVR